MYRLPDDAQEAEDEDPTGNTFTGSAVAQRRTAQGMPLCLRHCAAAHCVCVCVSVLCVFVNRVADGAGARTRAISFCHAAHGPRTARRSCCTAPCGRHRGTAAAEREDVDFFSHLEMFMRQENPPLSGRDHLAFRSAYAPVKNVLDGDLCDSCCRSTTAKARISNELEGARPPGGKEARRHTNRIL